MKMTRFISMAALALMGTVITACSSSDDGIGDNPPQPENTDKVVTLKTTVGFDGGGATTRALTSGGVKTFAVGETMALVYTNTSGGTVVVPSEALTDGDIAEGSKSATFTFNLTEEPDKTESVDYIYPAAMANDDGSINYDALLTEQDGTLTKLASNFDVATANNLAWVNGNLPGAELANQLAVLAVTVKDAGGAYDITSGIKGLTVSDGTNSYTVTRPAAAGPIYVAMLPTANADITVTATDGLINYEKTLADKTYEASKGYNVGWRMMPTKTTPLTMEALTDGTIVVNNPRSGMQYSKNGGANTAVTSDAISVSAGDKVQFYGNSAAYYSSSSDFTTIAGGTAEVKVYGNIMSLVNETGYADATTLPADDTFRYLFGDNSKLTDASGLLLPVETMKKECYYGMFSGCTSLENAPALPATTLAQHCYAGMFYGCTNLTAAPAELPAPTLTPSCYKEMFSGCSSLTTAPALPAPTLATSCYNGMFSRCSSLTDAPAVLPATTLADNCYKNMFSGCTSLKTAPALPATTLAGSCYYSMFADCTSLTTAPAELPATTLAGSCYYNMFAGCTSLTAAPVLPATTLAKNCYQCMFYGCKKLNSVTCLATDISASMCTDHWLDSAGLLAEGTKTFTTPSTTNWSIKDGTNGGIPGGWTRVDYVAPTQ